MMNRALFIIAVITTIFSCALYFIDYELLFRFTFEDGFYENLTALFLFATAFVLIYRFYKHYKTKHIWWKIGTLLMALAFFFGGGEEISWGQRIFGIESNEFFNSNNAQQETNLHNIQIGDVKLNKLIFSKLLSVVFGIYFLVLPILYDKIKGVKNLVNRFAVILPTYTQVTMFVVCTVLILTIVNYDGKWTENRKWEIWEFLFGFTIFWISCFPKNEKEIY